MTLPDLALASNGYGQSKAIPSDLLYLTSSRSGIKSTTIRLGQVAGPVGYIGSAQWNINEWLPSLTRTSKQLNMLPQTIPLLNEIDWVPVDRTAQILIELAMVQSYFGKELKMVLFKGCLRALEGVGTATTERNVATMPALEVTGYFRDLEEGQAQGAQQTLLETDETRKASSYLASLRSVDASMMTKRLMQWNY
ncbi:hypothetical protein F5Y16DRAFT_417081 [Xylariaceae sp. FL0255]|nr:hypothetical protein F5Y16DRAFT_417081 [Xylariaceae sp. FL0255]